MCEFAKLEIPVAYMQDPNKSFLRVWTFVITGKMLFRLLIWVAWETKDREKSWAKDGSLLEWLKGLDKW